ncbi:MAG: N-acetyltransferase [Candidatus Thorarchaeota archaeon]|nr:N-acetyltransferase [Candidatus Thorarchaeota archaeon]
MYFGERVCLRALEVSDLDKILEHWNTFAMRRYLGTALPMSENAERTWLEKATQYDPWKDGQVVLAVEDKKSKEFLGTVSLFGISKALQRAELGIAIHNEERMGKGYGTDAVKVMLWIGFHVLGLNSIYLYHAEFNDRGKRAYEKAGFKPIGAFRQAVYMEGEFHDLLAMDILRSEFLEAYPPGTFVGNPP